MMEAEERMAVTVKKVYGERVGEVRGWIEASSTGLWGV